MRATSNSKLRTLASYTAWTLGAQVATAILQFGYAAVTSRFVPDTGFGAFAVALSLSALVSLIAQGGLGQSAARTPTMHPHKLSFLMLFAVGLGVIAGLLLVVLAEPWSRLWDAPAAVAPARVIGLAAFLAPLSGLLLGVLRRLGEFKVLALSAVITSAVGMGIGVFAVILAPSPMTLLVSPVLTAILMAAVMLILTRHHWWARPASATEVRADLGFAWRVLGLTMLSYLVGNVGKWSVSRWVGADALGQWNRADVITAVPIEQATGALARAVYPEFRHDVGVQSRTRQAWTDYLVLTAWASFPVAAILAGAAPMATETIFGPGWGLAAAIAPLVAIRSGISAVDTGLASALESIGQFRLLTTTALVSVAVIAVGAALTAATGSWMWSLYGLIVAAVVRHLINVIWTARIGALDGRSIVAGYLQAICASIVVGGSAALVCASILGRASSIAGTIGVAIVSGVLGTCFAKWRSLPPTRILLRYRVRVSRS